MSNQTLPATVDPAELKRLAALMGSAPQDDFGGDRTPQFKVNYSLEDEQERQLPRGKFTITGLEGEQVFADTATIRVLGQHFQYIDYDSKNNKLVSQTILVPNMRSEMPDDKGTTRCGMPSAKGKLTADQKVKFKSVRIIRQLRCLVTMTGHTIDGEEVTITDQPALFKLSGGNFMGFDEQVVDKLPRGRQMWDFNINLSKKKEKTGENIWYVIQYDVDLANPLPLTENVVPVLNEFLTSVEAQNSAIMQKHDKAMRSRQDDDSVLDGINGGSLDDDLSDEIPL